MPAIACVPVGVPGGLQQLSECTLGAYGYLYKGTYAPVYRQAPSLSTSTTAPRRPDGQTIRCFCHAAFRIIFCRCKNFSVRGEAQTGLDHVGIRALREPWHWDENLAGASGGVDVMPQMHARVHKVDMI